MLIMASRRRDVPNKDALINTRSDKSIAVGCERDRRNRTSVATECFSNRQRFEVPDLDGTVASTGDESLAIGQEGEPKYGIRMRMQNCLMGCVRIQLPQSHRCVVSH
jgi:hypothetical protein